MADNREHLLNLLSKIASCSEQVGMWKRNRDGVTPELARENQEREEKIVWDARREVSEMFDAASRHN